MAKANISITYQTPEGGSRAAHITVNDDIAIETLSDALAAAVIHQNDAIQRLRSDMDGLINMLFPKPKEPVGSGSTSDHGASTEGLTDGPPTGTQEEIEKDE